MNFGRLNQARLECCLFNSRFSEDVQAVGVQRGPPHMRGWKDAYLALTYAGPVTKAAVAGSPTRLGGRRLFVYIEQTPNRFWWRFLGHSSGPGPVGGPLLSSSLLELVGWNFPSPWVFFSLDLLGSRAQGGGSD